VFREIGYADELGSGMRNTNKYTKMYSGGTPVFKEGDIFVTTIPLTNVADVKIGPKRNVGQGVGQDVGQGVGQEENLEDKILQMISENNKVTKKEIAQSLGVSEKTIERHMKDMDNIEYVGRGYSGYWHIKE
jgi:ATP-dependent DNA helicase RecG